MATGRLSDARQLWADAAAAAVHGAPASRQAALRLREAEAEALLGDPSRARLAADAALALDAQPGTLLAAAIVHALTGNPGRSHALMEDAGRVAAPGIGARSVWLPISRALYETAAGRHDQARELLAPVARFERGRDYGLAPLGVRGYIDLAAGHAREAGTSFESLLLLRAVAPTSPWVAFAKLGLARAYREAGDVDGSRKAYRAFIEAMQHADTNAPLLVAARRELAGLGGH
jgi:tetratricopeptide (TPR) repeat protein